MFCSSCGVAVTQGLSYCNYCGAKLNRGESDEKGSEIRPESLIFGILATLVFGMLAITILMGVMKAVLNVPVVTILAFAIVPFLLVLVLEFVFIRLLLRQTRTRKETNEAPSKGQATNELDAAHARALPEHMSSVTEHTTRAFDPIYTERNKH
jgi:hypothetical protein